MKYARHENVTRLVLPEPGEPAVTRERDAVVTSMFMPHILAQYSLTPYRHLEEDLQKYDITLPGQSRFWSVQRYASNEYRGLGIEGRPCDAVALGITGFARVRKYSRRGNGAIERLYAMGPSESHEAVITRLDDGDDDGEMVPLYDEPSLLEKPFAYIDLDAQQVGDTTERLRAYNLELQRSMRPLEHGLGRPALLLTTKYFVRARY